MSGMFIVLEGSDGSGKATQLKILAERLRAVGHEVATFEFPRYSEDSSYFVKRYLEGEYGPATDVSPYTASLFYALDRFEAAPQIRQSLADGKIVLADRYTASNMAHQGTKFENSGEQRGFFMWADSLEYELLGIPRPTITFFLRVPVEVSDKLMSQKKRDQHESNIAHLRAAVAAYDNLCRLFPKDHKVIECAKQTKMRGITDINNEIWRLIKPRLPKPSRAPKEIVFNLNQKKPEPRKQTNSLILKDISLLAVRMLQNSQSPYITTSYQWPVSKARVRFNYYIPPGLPPRLTKKYHQTMEELSRLYEKMRSKDDSQSLSAVVPVAVLTQSEIKSPQAAEAALKQAQISKLPELNQLSQQKQITQPANQPEELKEIIKNLSNSRLPMRSSDKQVQLIDFWPRNEFELLVEILAVNSELKRDDIVSELDKWPYERKAKALKAAAQGQTDWLLDKIRYRFDLTINPAQLEALSKELIITEMTPQLPNPINGYDVPAELEATGLDEIFISCFDRSLELYSELQSAGYQDIAAYATLSGHLQHTEITTSGRLLTSSHKELKLAAAEVHPIIAAAIQPTKRSPELHPNRSKKSKKKGLPRTKS